ncbi:hypothetical protein ACFC5X_19705 [Streptomyces sp. NPDC055952]|uniref:hypothetical protein n=1 Tax=Streptomyces sp. NPDC055952 TaxID=3345663 RepID=UPI0035D81159
MNAVTESPEAEHPLHAVVEQHGDWLLGRWAGDLWDAGVTDPAAPAARPRLLHDGGPVGSRAVRSVEPVRQAGLPASELLTRELHS